MRQRIIPKQAKLPASIVAGLSEPGLGFHVVPCLTATACRSGSPQALTARARPLAYQPRPQWRRLGGREAEAGDCPVVPLVPGDDMPLGKLDDRLMKQRTQGRSGGEGTLTYA